MPFLLIEACFRTASKPVQLSLGKISNPEGSVSDPGGKGKKAFLKVIFSFLDDSKQFLKEINSNFLNVFRIIQNVKNLEKKFIFSLYWTRFWFLGRIRIRKINN